VKFYLVFATFSCLLSVSLIWAQKYIIYFSIPTIFSKNNNSFF